MEYFVSTHPEHAKAKVSIESIIESAKVALIELDKAIEINAAALAAGDKITKSQIVYLNTRIMNDVREHGHTILNYAELGHVTNNYRGYNKKTSPSRARELCLEEVDKAHQSLTSLRNFQKKFIDEAGTNGLSIGHWFVSLNDNFLRKVRVIDGLECVKCGAILTRGGMKVHLNSFVCAVATATKDVKHNKWVEVVDGAQIAAIRQAGTQYAIVPSGFSMWVPPWVIKEIECWQTNPQFAGLNMSDYLAKMSPDGTQLPVKVSTETTETTEVSPKGQ